MEAGLAHHVWTVEELVEILPEPVAMKRGSYKKSNGSPYFLRACRYEEGDIQAAPDGGHVGITVLSAFTAWIGSHNEWRRGSGTLGH
jgi:hypothetical protein